MDNLYINISRLDEGYKIFLKASIGLTCTASSVGSILIILSYLLFKDIRTIPRQLLFNLSLADLLTALANFFGLLFNFETYYTEYHHGQVSNAVHGACIAQAATSSFATTASILWTIIIAVYMFLLIAIKKPDLANKTIPLQYIVCWGVPLAITIWFILVGYFGYEIGTTPGWCTILATNVNGTKEMEIYPITIGYTIFVYIAFVTLPVLYIWIRCHVRIMIDKSDDGTYQLNLKSVAKTADLKMIFIPIIFIAIRIWSLVVDTFDYYVDKEIKQNFVYSTVGAIFILAKASQQSKYFDQKNVHLYLISFSGIGDSSQGIANSILFIGFTKSVRVRLWLLIKRLFTCCCYCSNKYDKTHMMVSSVSETTALLSENNTTTEVGLGTSYDSSKFQIN